MSKAMYIEDNKMLLYVARQIKRQVIEGYRNSFLKCHIYRVYLFVLFFAVLYALNFDVENP